MATEQTGFAVPGTLVPSDVYFIEDATSNADNDITGAPDELCMVKVDCTDNTTEDVYVRVFTHASPAVGTEKTEMVLRGEKGKVMTFVMREAQDVTSPSALWRGVVIATAISIATVTEAGGSTGSTSPTGTVALTIATRTV